MSKWTQKTRRGGARQFGTLPPPSDTDWIASPGASGAIIIHRYNPIPLPATQVEARYRLVAATTWLYWTPQQPDTWSITGLTPGATYEVQISWWAPTARASEYSASKTATAGS